MSEAEALRKARKLKAEALGIGAVPVTLAETHLYGS